MMRSKLMVTKYQEKTEIMAHHLGVVIYFKENLNVSEVAMDFNVESTWLNVIIKGPTFLLCCVYRPPSDKKFLQNSKIYLDSINHRTNIVIVGYTNFDLNPCNNTNTTTHD